MTDAPQKPLGFLEKMKGFFLGDKQKEDVIDHAHEAEKAAKREAQSATIIGKRDKREKKIVLFIDDNNDFLNLMCEELECDDFQIKTTLITGDSGNVVDSIRTMAPDLIFLDVLFAKKFSNALVVQLRKDVVLKETPIYLVSSLDIAEIMLVADKDAVNGCFEKPIKRTDVTMLFDKHFGITLHYKED